MLPVVCLNHLTTLRAHLADVPTLMYHAILGARIIKRFIKINSFLAKLMTDNPTDANHSSQNVAR